MTLSRVAWFAALPSWTGIGAADDAKPARYTCLSDLQVGTPLSGARGFRAASSAQPPAAAPVGERCLARDAPLRPGQHARALLGSDASARTAKPRSAWPIPSTESLSVPIQRMTLGACCLDRIDRSNRAARKIVHLRSHGAQVRRAQASPHTATMINLEAVGDRPVGLFPADAVSKEVGAVAVAMTVPGGCIDRSGPQPAGTEIGGVFGNWSVLIDLGPKTGDLRGGRMLASARAVTCRFASAADAGAEQRVAGRAYALGLSGSRLFGSHDAHLLERQRLGSGSAGRLERSADPLILPLHTATVHAMERAA